MADNQYIPKSPIGTPADDSGVIDVRRAASQPNLKTPGSPVSGSQKDSPKPNLAGSSWMADFRRPITQGTPQTKAPLGSVQTAYPQGAKAELQSQNEKPVEGTTPYPVEDKNTDRAVDDIVRSDSDEVLMRQDELTESSIPKKHSPWDRLRYAWVYWWASPRKRWATIGALVLIIGGVFAVPYTRYNSLGLVVKSNILVTTIDSKTGKPVSGATVMVGNLEAKTGEDGKALLKVPTGSREITASKRYYSGHKVEVLVTLSEKKNTYSLPVAAIGRKIDIEVKNKVSGASVAGVQIEANGIEAKTDTLGKATLVLATGAANIEGKIKGDGYASADISISTDGGIAKNTFTVRPVGRVYFLSNLSGKTDVVSTNLDGTERKMVLAGTGSEDDANTSLLVSSDWKYLALISRRSGENSNLYLIDTTKNNKLSIIGDVDSDYTPIGWSGHNFVYQLTKNPFTAWQNNRQALKSYNADTTQTLLLDQTQGSGTSLDDFTSQYFGSSEIMGAQIVYVKNWQASDSKLPGLSSKSATLDTISADGSGHKVIKSFALTGQVAGIMTDYINTRISTSDLLYVAFQTTNVANFFTYDGTTINPSTTLTADSFAALPPVTYYFSPSSGQSFWTDTLGGTKKLQIGDKNAKNAKQILDSGVYDAYSWFDDNYLLLSKNGRELYVYSSKDGGTPLLLTDNYKVSTGLNMGNDLSPDGSGAGSQ